MARQVHQPAHQLDSPNAVLRVSILLDRIDTAAERVSLSLDHWGLICAILLPEIYPALGTRSKPSPKNTEPGTREDIQAQQDRVANRLELGNQDDKPETPTDPTEWDKKQARIDKTRGRSTLDIEKQPRDKKVFDSNDPEANGSFEDWGHF